MAAPFRPSVVLGPRVSSFWKADSIKGMMPFWSARKMMGDGRWESVSVSCSMSFVLVMQQLTCASMSAGCAYVINPSMYNLTSVGKMSLGCFALSAFRR